MASTSLALIALAGTGVLAIVELVARRLAPAATRAPASTLGAALAACAGGALVVAGLASVSVAPTVGLLALAVTAIAGLAGGLLSVAARTARDDDRPTAPPR